MVHKLEHRPQDYLFVEGNTTFLSMGAFKLSVLGKACLTPGVAAFIGNLCKTVADADAAGELWQNQYEFGLGQEIYEIPLSVAYHGSKFHEVMTDVLARSAHGSVYLVGLTENYLGVGGRMKVR